MKPTQDLHIQIPAAIAALPDLNLIEKAVLSRVHECPACSNPGLAKLTGLSVRGVESTLARLKGLGLIRSRGHGQARRLSLAFPVEHHTACSEDNKVKPNTACGERHENEHHMACGESPADQPHMSSGIQDEQPVTMESVTTELDGAISCVRRGEFALGRQHHAKLRGLLTRLGTETLAEAEPQLETFHEVMVIAEAAWDELSKLAGEERDRLLASLYTFGSGPLSLIRRHLEEAKARGEVTDLRNFLSR